LLQSTLKNSSEQSLGTSPSPCLLRTSASRSPTPSLYYSICVDYIRKDAYCMLSVHVSSQLDPLSFNKTGTSPSPCLLRTSASRSPTPRRRCSRSRSTRRSGSFWMSASRPLARYEYIYIYIYTVWGYNPQPDGGYTELGPTNKARN